MGHAPLHALLLLLYCLLLLLCSCPRMPAHPAAYRLLLLYPPAVCYTLLYTIESTQTRRTLRNSAATACLLQCAGPLLIVPPVPRGSADDPGWLRCRMQLHMQAS